MAFLHSGYNSKINLSAKEMLEISLEISRNFTPCLLSQVTGLGGKIRLSPRELLDIGEQISRDFAPKPVADAPELTLLPVDPGHLHAYWNLGESREISSSGNDNNNQLTLRVYSQPEKSAAPEAVTWFDVVIGRAITHQHLSLPSPADDTVYSAAIGKCGADDGFIELAHSNFIHAHSGQTAWTQAFAAGPAKNASGLGVSK